MNESIKRLKKQIDSAFEKKTNLLSFWQESAEQLYPERADFTTQRFIGEDLTTNLSTSYPVIARRQLGDAISAMLRPRNQDWFNISVEDDDDLGHEAKEWLEMASAIQRRAMYDRSSQFVRATKEADHDFASFGQAVISKEINRKTNALMFRCWHLRDVAWEEGYDGVINRVYRKTKTSLANFAMEFGEENISDKAKQRYKKDPSEKIEYYHAVVPVEFYQSEQKFGTKYVSAYIECETDHRVREVASKTLIYTIPRWATVSGSQYAYSPATVAALPDARLLQNMTLSLLEAGEMATNPPMFARQEVFRGDIQRFAEGITFVDLDPEQRIQDAVHFQPIDANGMSRGMEMQMQVIEMIAKAFYLDRLTLPQAGPDMTAYEVSQRVSEHIRNALPLFEPMEQDYNAPLCLDTFELLMENGAFGPDNQIPDELRGRDIVFKFESPLHEAIEKQKANTYIEGLQLVAQTTAIDPNAAAIIKPKIALRDSLEGIKYPMEWLTDEEEIKQIEDEQAAQAQAQQMMQMMEQGGNAAAAVGSGAESLQAGGVI